MRRNTEPKRQARQRRHSRPIAQGEDVAVEQLRRRFAKFRQERRSRTGFPDTLRGAVLAAMQQGVTAREVRRACGVTARQLEQWRQGRGSVVAPVQQAVEPAQMFSVTHDALSQDGGVNAGERRQPLELRLGDWSVSIRMTPCEDEPCCR